MNVLPPALATALLLSSGAAAQPEGRLRYVANAGVLISLTGQDVLIDAAIRDGIPPYATPLSEERTRLERARPPYDSVDVILVTHWHEDHFSPEAVAAHLSNNPRSVLVSSEEIVERVRPFAKGIPRDRLRGTTPSPGEAIAVTVGALGIHVLRIRHNPTRRNPEQHVGFLIEGGGTAVLHVGDADPAAANFDVLRKLPQIDVAVVPFWYVTDDETRGGTVQALMKPNRIVAMHIPPQDAAKVAHQIRESGRAVTLLLDPGATIGVSNRGSDPGLTPV